MNKVNIAKLILFLSVLIIQERTSLWAEDTRLTMPKISVGAVLTLTGPYASLGADCQRGIKLAYQSGGSEHVNIVYGDAQSEPKVAVSEFKKMLASDSIQIGLTIRSPMGMALNPISSEAKVPLLGCVGYDQFPVANKYAFQFWSSGHEDGRALGKIMKNKGGKRVALLTTDDEWTISVSEGFKNSATQHELKIVYDQAILPSDMEFASLISAIKRSNADSIFINTGITQMGPIAKKIREQGLKQNLYSTFWIAKPEVLDSTPHKVLENLYFAEASLKLPKFREALRASYGDDRASQMTYACYAAQSFAQQGIVAFQNNGEAKNIYSVLLEQNVVKLPDENMQIINRRAQFKLAAKKIQAGQIVEEELL